MFKLRYVVLHGEFFIEKTSLTVYTSFVSGHLCSQAILSVSLFVINEKEWGLSKSFVAIDNVANTEKF